MTLIVLIVCKHLLLLYITKWEVKPQWFYFCIHTICSYRNKNEIYLSLSRGEPTALVLFDLSAAFNTIDHKTLVNCLKDWFGVAGTALGCFLQLRYFRRIWGYLPSAIAILVANALISSRLDYCNSLFRSLSRYNLHNLQCFKTVQHIFDPIP